MDVGRPYRALLSDLSGAVLRVLHDTSRPLTGRDIHRLVESASVGGVRKVLIRLVGQGLVVEQRAGSAILYTANTVHLAWPAVTVLMTMRRELRNRLARLMASWEPQPLLSGLFGSAARGDGDSMSDVDILIVRPEILTADDGDRWDEHLDQVRDVVLTATGNRAQLLVLDLAGMHALILAREPIVGEWRRDLVVTAGSARLLDGTAPATTAS